MSDSKWFEESKALRQLPSPTGVVLRLLKLTDDEGTSVAELAAALQLDPALAGRVLKYANSAFVGGARKVV
ncbi:MAG: HDOD domain-containing protein, partial [Gemmataceae bacterium]|nr:HDOD domain-containing protein [Gemmataceae bacterium]